MTVHTLQAAAVAPLTCQKSAFSLPPESHYLDCAYMSPLSKAVEAAEVQGVTRKSNPINLPPETFFAESERARALFACLVNATADRVAIIPAVSYGVATVAKNLRVRPGQNIVVPSEQFPSNVYAWRKFAEHGAELRTVAPPAGVNRGELWNEHLLAAIDADTALVAVEHAHWTDGTRFDLAALGARAREVGALFVVDATQSVGALPFDVAAWQPDALLVAGYKTLMGPYGLGFAYYGPRFDDGVPLEDNWLTRHGSEDFSRLVDYQDRYAPGAVRFDMGERSNPILLPMVNAALEQLLERRPERVQAYCRALVQDTLNELRDYGYRLEAETHSARHLFGLRLPPTVELSAVKERLHAARVIVSVRSDAVRVAPNVYNDEADMKALRDALLV
ncbi:aminotransferase class V-fold PLP-dependent enzyme [soil metagenome]